MGRHGSDSFTLKADGPTATLLTRYRPEPRASFCDAASVACDGASELDTLAIMAAKGIMAGLATAADHWRVHNVACRLIRHVPDGNGRPPSVALRRSVVTYAPVSPQAAGE